MRPFVPLLTVLVVLLAGPARAGKADDAYEGAKASYLALKKDEARRQFRHHWQNAARKFGQVARKYPRSERAPEALFMAGQLNNELSRISGRDEDVAEAERSYRRLIDGWPKHRLTDDAALALARLLADRRDDPAAARALLEAGLPYAKDQKSAMQHLLAALPKPASAPKLQAPAQARGGKSSEALRGREEARSAAAGSSGERAERRAGVPGSGAEGDGARLASAGPDRDSSVSDKSDRDDAASGRSERDDAPSAASGKSDRDDARAVSGKSDRDDAASGRSDRDDLRAASGKSHRDNASSGTSDAVSAASGRSLRGDARAASGKSGGPGSAPGLSLADAIRRATSPLARLNGLPGDEAPQARRAPPLRPGKDDGADSDEVLDEAEDTPLASLQERLRDVRVGPGPGAPAVAAEAKSRFAKLAKGEAGAELTLAQQLGLKVKRVIVDAGHGGHDTGAIGKKGTREKDVSLAIAKKLGEKLEALGLEVVLTRDDDTFVKLEDRTRFANREKGDLFISIHCNAAPSAKLRGIETYSLNTSSNRYAIRLAARENATTERGVGDLQYILADLATKANTGESTRLAERVQQTLVRNLSGSYKDVKNLGHKEALFFVLLGARMPAVLVETSFLSNEEEEARLSDEAYQQSVADSIAEAVQGFLEERNRLAQVD